MTESTPPEPGADHRRIIPPVVYLPVQEQREDGAVRYVVRGMRDGRDALLAYTALDRLADGCGPHQPWQLHATESLGQVRDRQPYDVILFDMEVPDHARDGGRIR